MTSNVGQNYPYSSESEADREATISSPRRRARRAGQDDRGRDDAGSTTNERWWVWKCPTPGCPGLLHVAGLRPRPARRLRRLRRDLRQDVPALTAGAPADWPERSPPPLDPVEPRRPPAARRRRRRASSSRRPASDSSSACRPVGRLLADRGDRDEHDRLRRGLPVRGGRATCRGGLAWPAIVLADRPGQRPPPALLGRARARGSGGRRRRERAVMAHVLTDEAFALTIVHFRRLGRADPTGYWIAAIGSTFIPWNLATILGVLVGGAVHPDPQALGLDVDLSGRDGRPRGRPDHRTARAGRRRRRRSSCAVVDRACLGQPAGDRRRRPGRAARRAGRPGRPSRSAARVARRPSRSTGRPEDGAAVMSTNLVGLAVLMGAGDLSVAGRSRCWRRASTGCRRSRSTTSAWSDRRSSPRSPRSSILVAAGRRRAGDRSTSASSGWRSAVCIVDRRLAAEPAPRPRRGGRDRGRRPSGRLACLPGRSPGRLRP